ncbi:unknown [Firmicutes bacterium CAG:313]|nr:unknown [Firmicutes bacterium CAG:313]
MKKKNLIILLLIPFVITLVGVITINTTFNFIENDMIGIDWSYDEIEGIKLEDKLHKLVASPIYEQGYPPLKEEALVWSVYDSDNHEENKYAKIVNENDNWYLQPLQIGEVKVTCSNKKGNIFKTMTVIIFKEGAIVVQSKIKASQNNIDPNIYYGEYDFDNNLYKQKATFEFEVKTIGDLQINDLQYVNNTPDIIEIDEVNKIVKIKTSGDASFTVKTNNDEMVKPMTYSFKVVKDGVNVYDYNQLLACTNKSTNGEIVVLRKSFESVNNLNNTTDNNVVCFGNYTDGKKIDFTSDVYSFETTYNQDYIKAWNEFVNSNPRYKKISNRVLAGIRVQKDFYGNGYTINLHNLTFPSSTMDVVDSNGNKTTIPALSKDDLYRGPLPFYSLGEHDNMPLIEAFGQDNVGMYVDGSNILINDVNLKNCDFGNLMSNLDYVGTVLETNGNNITIKNSRLSNGKQVVRSFSSTNVSIVNSMLSNARNFLLTIGSNDYIKADLLKEYEFTLLNGEKITSTINNYLMKSNAGDDTLNAFVIGSFTDKEKMRKAILDIQNALNDESLIKDIYKGSMNIKDTMFYRSGIASIGMDTMFSGPFLESSTPSVVNMLLTGLNVPYIPNHVGGMSYPVELNITGKTKFYDYKEWNNLDITGLINENISSFVDDAKEMFGVTDANIGDISIDTIFPIKSFLKSSVVTTTSSDGKVYVNIPIAYYGGGANLSKVTFDTEDLKYDSCKLTVVDLLDKYLSLKGIDLDNINLDKLDLAVIKNVMLKCVTIVTGYEPFKFISVNKQGYLFDEGPRAPQALELIKNAQGE